MSNQPTKDSTTSGTATPSKQKAVPPKKQQPKVVAAYFADWSIYDRRYSLDKVPGQNLTHVLYAFLAPMEDGSVKPLDLWADLEWGPQDQNSDTVEGCIRRMAEAKRKFPHLKFLMSIGGWTKSTHFSTIAADAKKRQVFAQTSAALVSQWGFDGVDIDWEYPGSEGAPGNKVDKDDPKNFILLLRDVRTALDEAAKLDQQPTKYLLTAALPATKEKAGILDIKGLGRELDYLFLMTYDKSGMGWSEKTEHQSDVRWIRDIVNFYSSKGVSSGKLVVGSPLYGRVFTKTEGLDKPFEKTWDKQEGQWETHIWDYKKLPRPGAKVYWDDGPDASYSYDADKKEFITFDTPKAVMTKCTHVYQKNLGGIFFWEMSADKTGEESLIETAYTELAWKRKVKMEHSKNHLKYPRSKWTNIQNM